MIQRRGRGRGERAGLSRESIIAAGLTLSREVPPGRFSVRSLAERLGVDAMAIHYWFRGRDALMDAVAGAALASVPPPAAGDAWESRLRSAASALLETVLTHPGLAWADRRVDIAGGSGPILAAVHTALAVTGLPERDALSTVRVLMDLAIAQSPATHDEARFRAGVGLVIDGLRMRAMERRAAAGER